MMKSKLIAAILLLTLCFSLCACGRGSDDSKESSDASDIQTENQENSEEQNAENEQAQQVVQSSQEAEEGMARITVYYSNADATGFESVQVQIASLSPNAVLGALVSQGALTADIVEKSFALTTIEGKASIELDLNDAFTAYVSNMGTAGEYYAVGALCNTFLEAYDCEQIRITVDGDTLSTGHAEYPGYLSKFQ